MKYMLGLNSENLTIDDKEIMDMFDGVGMIRGENLCLEEMKYFPNQDFQKHVKNYLDSTARLFEGRNVWYRTADLVPHQINLLDGADKKFIEGQYIVGTRGIRRNLECKETYLKELNIFIEAYKNNKNLGILIPFVSKPEEMRIVINILRNKFKYDGKIGMMVETPSSVIRLDEFEKLGIDNYTLGMNDLTTLVLGADRNSKTYDMCDKGVLEFVKIAKDKIHSYGKKITVAGYLTKEFCDCCEEIGVDYCNIHYNLIPEIFKNVENPEKFPQKYDKIRENYKRKKVEMLKTTNEER